MATKNDLVNKLSKKLEYLSHEDITLAFDSVVEFLKDNLSRGNRIEIRGFGSFSVRQRKVAGKEEYYKTIYYRQAKNIHNKLNEG